MSEPVKIMLQVQGAVESAAALQHVGRAAASVAQSASQAVDAVAAKLLSIVSAEAETAKAAEKADQGITDLGQHSAAASQAAGEAAKRLSAELRSVGEAAAAATQAAGRAADAVVDKFGRVVQRIGGARQVVPQVAGEFKPLPTVTPVVPPPFPSDTVPKVDGLTDALKRQQEAARSAGQGLGQMFNSVFRLVGLQSPLAGGVGQSAIAAQELAAGASAAAGGIGILATVAVAGLAAVAALAAGLFAAAKSEAAFADAQGKQAEKVGVTVEQWSKLQHAAKLSDVSSQQLTVALTHLSEQASKGSKAFDLLGISARRSDGETKSVGILIEEVADKFAGYKDGIDKTALAHELFGRSGREMLPWLNEGREGMQKWGDELERMGGVVGPEAAAEGDRLGDALERLAKVGEALWHQLGVRLVPMVADLAEKLVGLGTHAGKLGPIFDAAVFPVKLLAEYLGQLSDKATLAADVIDTLATAGFLLASGNGFSDAREELNKLTKDFEKYRDARNGVKSPVAGAGAQGKVAAPHLETAAEKEAAKEIEAEEKRQAEILSIRERGQLELQELAAKGRRSELDTDYREGRIGLENYYQRRRQLIETDYSLQLTSADITSRTQEDSQKADEQNFAAKQKAAAVQRNAEAELAREREADLEKMAKGQAKIEAEQLKADFAYEKKTAELARRTDIRTAELAIEEKSQRIQSIERDSTLSLTEQRQKLAAAVQEQIGLYPALVSALKAEQAAVDPEHKVEIQKRINELVQKESELLRNEGDRSRRIEVRQAELAIDEQSARVRTIEEDTTLRISERRRLTVRELQNEIALLPALITALRAEAAASDPEHALEVQQKINRAIQHQIELTNRLKTIKPTGFWDTFGRRIDEMGEKWGNFSQNMTDALLGPIDSAMNNLGDTVIDLASGMKSWGEVGLSMARQMASGFITAMGQMLVKQIFFHETTQAQKLENTATNTAALGPAAALAGAESGISFGTAAVIGLVAFAALMAAALAFEKGGPVPGGEQLIRVNEGNKPETVVNASATARWPGVLAAMNSGAQTVSDLLPNLPADSMAPLLGAAAKIQPRMPMPDFEAIAKHQAATAELSGRSGGMKMPAINVPKPQVQVLMVDGHRELQKVLNSKQGMEIVIKHFEKARSRLGFEAS